MEFDNSPFLLKSKVSENLSKLTKSDKCGVCLLHLLYFIQGLPIGFFTAMPLILIEKGASFNDLGILSFMGYPFAFKILLAPIEDSYYFENFGKRKTYIIPCQYILSFSFFILSFWIDDLIIEKNIFMIAAIGFFMILITASQDIAVDGWQLTLLRNEVLGWGAVAQSIGQNFGILIGNTLMIMLSSTTFCNNYIYYEIKNDVVLKVGGFARIFSILILVINIWIHLTRKENPNPNTQHESCVQIVKKLKFFILNRNLREYIIILLTFYLGFSVVMNSTNYILIQKGLSKEIVSSVSAFLFPVQCVVSYLIGKNQKIGHEMTFFLYICFGMAINNVSSFIFIVSFSIFSVNLATFIFIILALLAVGLESGIFVGLGAFQNRISDEKVGGTYLTFLNSVSNLGKMWIASFSFFLIERIGYINAVVIVWIIGVIYFIVGKNRILRLQNLDKTDFELS